MAVLVQSPADEVVPAYGVSRLTRSETERATSGQNVSAHSSSSPPCWWPRRVTLWPVTRDMRRTAKTTYSAVFWRSPYPSSGTDIEQKGIRSAVSWGM